MYWLILVTCTCFGTFYFKSACLVSSTVESVGRDKRSVRIYSTNTYISGTVLKLYGWMLDLGK